MFSFSVSISVLNLRYLVLKIFRIFNVSVATPPLFHSLSSTKLTLVTSLKAVSQISHSSFQTKSYTYKPLYYVFISNKLFKHTLSFIVSPVHETTHQHQPVPPIPCTFLTLSVNESWDLKTLDVKLNFEVKNQWCFLSSLINSF